MGLPVAPLLMMFGPPIFKEVIGLFHKDDPAAPRLDPAQGPQMIMERMLPMIMMLSMMGNDDDKGSGTEMLNMLMMMQSMGGGVAAQPVATSMQPMLDQMNAFQKQLQDMQTFLDSLDGKKKG